MCFFINLGKRICLPTYKQPRNKTHWDFKAFFSTVSSHSCCRNAIRDDVSLNNETNSLKAWLFTDGSQLKMLSHWHTASERMLHIRSQFCRGKWEALWNAAAKRHEKGQRGHKSVQTAMALLPSCAVIIDIFKGQAQLQAGCQSFGSTTPAALVLSTMHYFAFGLIKRQVESMISEYKNDLLLSWLSVSLHCHYVAWIINFLSYLSLKHRIALIKDICGKTPENTNGKASMGFLQYTN